MRPTHKNRNRSRHRSNSGGGSGGGGNPLSRVYESNGPDVKVRGTAQTVADKYLQLGRDAQSGGDIIMAESYFQYAEHYLRIVSAAQAYNQQNQQQYRRPDEDFDDEDLEDSPEPAVAEQRGGQQASEPDGLGDQPLIEGSERLPQHQAQQPIRQQRDYRDTREQGQRDQNRDQNRERFKPRWQDRRPDGQQGQSGDNRQNYQPRHEQQRTDQRAQPRIDPPPRMAEEPSVPAAAAPAAETETHWEAPSFLRRPAPASAAAEADEAGSPAAEAAAAPAKRKYERRPRKEPAAEAAAAPVGEPATD
jgi:hypothetical protein